MNKRQRKKHEKQHRHEHHEPEHARETFKKFVIEAEQRPNGASSTQIRTPGQPVVNRRPAVSKVVVVTSGKGGVGKTTTSANISTGIALSGKKTVAIDFDVGLRNLDLVMGCERRVVYDFVNVIRNEAKLNQALIRDKRIESLYVLPASQTRDKDALDVEGVGRVIQELKDMGFEYIICDSPAGIERGAQMAMYYADDAIVVTNPEVSSVRDSDRVLGLLAAKTNRAQENAQPIQPHLLLTRYSPAMVKRGEMLSVSDVLELLGIPLLGVIPESKAVLQSSNKGTPAILDETTDVAQAYVDVVDRFLGEERQHRFIEEERRGFFGRLFG
jgi:septum site-determining protein MinD